MVIQYGHNKLNCKGDSGNGPGGIFYADGTVMKTNQQLYKGPGGMFYVDGTVVKTNQQLFNVAPLEKEQPPAPALKMSKPQGEDPSKNWIKIDINKACELLSHVGALSLQKTAQIFEWGLVGEL